MKLRFSVVFAGLSAIQLGACSGSETTPSTGPGTGGSTTNDSGVSGTSGESGNAGSSGSSGTGGGGTGGATGGTGGTPNAMIANPRTCGMGAPCSPGATCEWSGLESGIDCECDDTGHYFCDAHAGGGAPPFQPCPPRQCAAAGETCELSNGYCTKTCVCGGACTTDCSGNGPPQHQGASRPCDLDFCKDSYLKWGGCSVKDGACDYTIDCTPADAPPNVEPTPVVTGRCD